MFFNIGFNPSDKFPVHITHRNLCIDLDHGWAVKGNTISKGLLENNCTITLVDSGIEIDFGVKRSFPLSYDLSNVSNLIDYDNKFTSNDELKILNNLVTLKKSSHSVTFNHLGLNDDQLFDHLYAYLDDKIKNFNTDLPIKIFPTGGVDISLLISFVLKHKKPYELVTAEYKAMDYFTCYNRALIGNNWAYRDIHYWTTPSILLSGTHGDEMMLRFPQHAYMIGKANGDNIIDTLKENKSLYHSHYFLRKKHQHLYDEADQMSLTGDELKNFILGRNSFDYQHWHLGETLTWTPLNDLAITNMLLNFSYNRLKGQLVDASISKELITRNNPNHLALVSPQKNVNHFNHLYKIFEGTEKLL